MSRFAPLVLLLSIVTSCGLSKKHAFQDLTGDLCMDVSCKPERTLIYRSCHNQRKLNGTFEHRTTDVLNSNIEYRNITNYKKGKLHGIDSIFRNDKIYSVRHYTKGILNGQETKFDDSLKVVAQFVNGVKHGWQNTYIDEIPQSRSFFRNGVKNSVEIFYDSLGVDSSSMEYYFNVDSNWMNSHWFYDPVFVR